MDETITAASITRVLGGQKTGRAYIARCPAHEDRKPSLSIADAPRLRKYVSTGVPAAGSGRAQMRSASSRLSELCKPPSPGEEFFSIGSLREAGRR